MNFRIDLPGTPGPESAVMQAWGLGVCDEYLTRPSRFSGAVVRVNEVTPKLGFGVLDVLASDARSLRCS